VRRGLTEGVVENLGELVAESLKKTEYEGKNLKCSKDFGSRVLSGGGQDFSGGSLDRGLKAERKKGSQGLMGQSSHR